MGRASRTPLGEGLREAVFHFAFHRGVTGCGQDRAGAGSVPQGPPGTQTPLLFYYGLIVIESSSLLSAPFCPVAPRQLRVVLVVSVSSPFHPQEEEKRRGGDPLVVEGCSRPAESMQSDP